MKAGNQTKTLRSFDYDHAGRLTTTKHKLNTEPEVLLSSNDYNEIGELIEKNLHSENGGSSFEQSIDYTYNIRGWLTAINDSDLNAESSDLFGMELHYNTNPLDGNRTNFNGNISGMKWSDLDASGSGVNDRGYTYTYDNLNRLKDAKHFENSSTSAKFSVPGIHYDLNGNIQSLERSAGSSALMDDLSYSYDGNQLLSVTDGGDDNAGFVDGNTSGNDYKYDKNGNMEWDKNKDIDLITYNHLNLPEVVTMDGTGNRIEYLYDAAGIKLKQEVFENNNSVKTTDYVGEFIYETLGAGNRKLQLIQHEEGRIIYEDFGHDWDYQYHLKDHLGNTRLTFSTLSQDPLVCIETFETGEDNGFQDLHRHVNTNANTTSGGNEVERLQSGQTGAMALLGVNKNDVVSLSVQANYESAPSGNSYAAIGSLFSSFDGTYGTVEGGGFASNSTEFQDAINGMTAKGTSNSDPRAFLNYIFFDLDMNYVSSGFDQISTAALGTGNHDLVQINNFTPDRDGYILAYLSNENSQALTMHFDDFTITQVKTNIVQADDYYPGGALFNSYTRTASSPQKFKYQGKEWMGEPKSYDVKWRQYDPYVWRTPTMDSNAEEYASLSPYSWVNNNPISNVDPDGMDWYRYVNDDGEESVVWRSGNDQTIDVDGNTYDNIGGAYAQTLNDGSVAIYNQDEVFAIIEADDTYDPQTAAVAFGLQNPDGQYNYDTMTPQWEMLFFSAETALMISGGSSQQSQSRRPRNPKMNRNSQSPRGQNAQLNDVQKANLRRFLKKAPANSKPPQVRKLGNGNIQLTIESPGKVPGSRALYIKEVDSNGQTVKMYKITRDPKGNVVHNKNKLR